MEKAKVYFTKEITPQKAVEMFEKLDTPLDGKVAVKVHTGEKGNQNYLRPDFLKPIVKSNVTPLTKGSATRAKNTRSC